MDAADIAQAFAAHLRAGAFDKAEAFWAEDVASLEAADMPMKELHGRAAVKAKGDWWSSAHEIHAFVVEGPYMHGDQFALVMKMDLTRKDTQERIKMEEVALYTVKNGKITEERFFY